MKVGAKRMARFCLLLLIFAILGPLHPLLPAHDSAEQDERPSEGAFVFVGWLEHAELVQIHLPSGQVVPYSGKKLEQIAKELREWEKLAEEKAKDEKKRKKKD